MTRIPATKQPGSSFASLHLCVFAFISPEQPKISTRSQDLQDCLGEESETQNKAKLRIKGNTEERETRRRRGHREEKHKEERNREERKDAWAAPSGLVDRPMGRRDKPSQEVEAVRPAEGLRPCQVVRPGSALRLEVTPG